MSELGRINVNVPKELHTALRVYCVGHGKTMAEAVAEALEHFLGDVAKKTKPTA